jgi:hypothetical protein
MGEDGEEAVQLPYRVSTDADGKSSPELENGMDPGNGGTNFFLFISGFYPYLYCHVFHPAPNWELVHLSYRCRTHSSGTHPSSQAAKPSCCPSSLRYLYRYLSLNSATLGSLYYPHQQPVPQCSSLPLSRLRFDRGRVGQEHVLQVSHSNLSLLG